MFKKFYLFILKYNLKCLSYVNCQSEVFISSLKYNKLVSISCTIFTVNSKNYSDCAMNAVKSVLDKFEYICQKLFKIKYTFYKITDSF